MARYQTRRRPESALQRDDVIPTPLDNIQPEESAALQPAAATSSGAASSPNQPMEVGQPVVQPSSTTFTPSGPTGMPIPSNSPVVRPHPGLEDQRLTHRLRTRTPFTGPESVLKRSK
eukprot:1376476-Amphidinium_carterae.1